MRNIICVNDLYKLYRIGDTAVRALNGVSFSIREGEFCAIVGTSGSGKSTLLNMLAGLERPTRGEVVISGRHIEKLREDELVKFRRENVGFIFQSFHLLGDDECFGECGAASYIQGRGKKGQIEKADRMLDLVNLGKHKRHMRKPDVRRTAAESRYSESSCGGPEKSYLPMSRRETWIPILQKRLWGLMKKIVRGAGTDSCHGHS